MTNNTVHAKAGKTHWKTTGKQSKPHILVKRYEVRIYCLQGNQKSSGLQFEVAY